MHCVVFVRCWAVVIAAAIMLLSPLGVSADWLCDGDRLSIERLPGAVDPGGLQLPLPNSADGTLPGDSLLLRWRGVVLQLPRTNNAGAPSYTDGRWWWRVVDPEHPEFRQRRGEVIRYSCELLEGDFFGGK